MKKFTATGECIIQNETISYLATTEEFIFSGTNGEAEAYVYTISYERQNDEQSGTRPILFAYNGGPGAASIFVHMGLLAPERLHMGDGVSLQTTPPYTMENNPATVLDVCDIVVIDPVGTGYSRLLNDSAADNYYNSVADANSIIRIMRAWLTRHNRWNSPLFIMGESYGTIRNALVADALFYDENSKICAGTCIHLSGIIMIGTALDHGQKPFLVDTAVLNFTAIASTYWYHDRDGKPSLKEFIRQATEFAYREYLPALALGNRLESGERNILADRIHYFTGLSPEQILKVDLRVDTYTYPQTGMAEKGKLLSRYDGRFCGIALKDPAKFDMFCDDPANQKITAACACCFNSIWKKRLNIELDEEYEMLSASVGEHWKFQTPRSPKECLELAMRRNPKMKLLFATGYYDMLTTQGYTRYLASQLDVDPLNVRIREYEAGHMPYLGEESASALGEDLREFILWGIGKDV